MFQEIIDIEWGAFGDNGVLDFFKQWADFQVDKNSNHVGSFTWVLPTLLMTCFPHGFVRDLHRPLHNKKYFFLYSRIDVFENWFIYLIWLFSFFYIRFLHLPFVNRQWVQMQHTLSNYYIHYLPSNATSTAYPCANCPLGLPSKPYDFVVYH